MRLAVCFSICLASACGGTSQPPPAAASPKVASTPKKNAYPEARKQDIVEDKGGVKFADPYRWLEDVEAKETKDWVTKENALADAYFAKLPIRETFRARLTELLRVESTGDPRREGGRSFWLFHDATHDQPVLVTASSFESEAVTLVDPNEKGTNGVETFSGYAVAKSGRRVAYGLASGGGDWETWRVRDVSAPAAMPDELAGIKYYQPVFTSDGTGLFYSRFPAPKPGAELTETDHDCKVYFHKIGRPVGEDLVVYQRPDQPTWQFDLTMANDGKTLYLLIGDGQVGDRRLEQLVALDPAKPKAKPVSLIDRYEAEFVPVGTDGSKIYLLTDLDAPTKRVIAIDARSPARASWKEIVPAGADVINQAKVVGGQLFVVTLHDVQSRIAAYDLGGKKIRDVPLPGLGTSYVSGSDARDARDAFVSFTSFAAPFTLYRHDLASGKLTPWRAPRLAFDPAALETRQVFYASKDGTKVPMFILAKKGTPLDGTAPTILTGYGGFGIPYLPDFDAPMVAWVEHGGVFVVANIRGGGDYGEAWHRAAIREKKQVSYDDFIAAAQALIAMKVTSTPHLGIVGTSGGGQLVGSVLMQRPDLYGAAVPIAGVLDLARFHLFGQGAGWGGDLGSPDDPADLRVLLTFSPVHNVRPGTVYPPTFVITADHDVRVAPLHSYKLAAAMQAAQGGSAPILLRVDTDSGHGGGGLVSQKIDQNAEILAFFAETLGLK